MTCRCETLKDKALVFTTAQARVLISYKSISPDRQQGYCAATMDVRDTHPQQIKEAGVLLTLQIHNSETKGTQE